MTLRFMAIEYLPHAMHQENVSPVRIDGHYRQFEDAKDIAEMWAENPGHPETRIAVASVEFEAKQPERWKVREQKARTRKAIRQLKRLIGDKTA